MKKIVQNEKRDIFEITYAISLITQIGVVVSVITISFIYSGYYLDKQLDKSPIFVIFGALFAFIFSMYGVYRLVLPISKKKEKKEDAE
ncbi:MAG: AtpZ/AtpI family protein [Candidatus Pacebacteria bacterium]|nr:AtpZ/AtpI family protein [Candidatus Paceibacterota bacterium]